jgi:hypothetical protein
VWRAILHPARLCVLASDSAVALALVDNVTNHPGPWLAEHKHRHLLLAIRDAIAARPAGSPPLLLVKVRSHAGVAGNLAADWGAAAAARDASTATAPPAADHAEAWDDVYWPYSFGGTRLDGAPRLTAVDGLGPGLKRVVLPALELGAADRTGYYYTSWQGVLRHVEPTLSNAFLSAPGVRALWRRRTLQYRTGTLVCSRGACPLCGEPSNGHHSVSSCPHLEALVTARHHRAGRSIMAAVRGGRVGAFLVGADVGADAAADAGGALPRGVPPDLLPGGTAPSRPDLVLCVPASPSAPPVVLCVEIKYCCDYRPDACLARVAAQHAALVQALSMAGHQVRVVPLLLGVSGTIYKSTLQALRTDLGVSASSARELCSALHVHAVRSLSSIFATKCRMDTWAVPAPPVVAAPPGPAPAAAPVLAPPPAGAYG